jgi:predicted RNase H-like HicB family nuclease
MPTLSGISEKTKISELTVAELKELIREVIEEFRVNRYEVEVKGKKYVIILHPDTDDGGYWVECPELPGCLSQGDTVEEAIEMIKDAIEGHLEILEEDTKRQPSQQFTA